MKSLIDKLMKIIHDHMCFSPGHEAFRRDLVWMRDYKVLQSSKLPAMWYLLKPTSTESQTL